MVAATSSSPLACPTSFKQRALRGAVADPLRSSSQRSLGGRHQIRTIVGEGGTRHKLNTGAEIPALGIGTWRDADKQEQTVLTALKAGYRHIDTARIYGTEPAVASAIEASGVPRSSIFLTTKLWNNSHAPSDVEPALDASLQDLRTPYVDLYLMHWPSPLQSGPSLRPTDARGAMIPGAADYVDTWRAMEALLRTGKARAIGVSNLAESELRRLLRAARVAPAVHQLELHPWLQQRRFVTLHRRLGIHVTQYSPFGNANPAYAAATEELSPGERLIEDPVLVEIGRKYGKSGAQVALAWGIRQGRSVIPKSVSPERVRHNLEGDFELAEEDLRRIDGLDRALRFNDPSARFRWNYYADLEGKRY
ncbi:NADP-dependent oxidoreductase domain-containing protein [Lineolata rhizophorae]|uniref:NADP-dependent oxidoreductase domain-containing protein n=1 Tax=Lineolata rhizophorae TaxID=578093 RepID=A0A6A6PCK9_9PEZI|nr:NADP-dependent oxidoreductase domain-containing protein [Lineolata rhizophorae]